MFGKFVVNASQSDNGNDENTEEGEFERTSCFCLKRTFFVRKWLIHLVYWPWFERLSMLVILVNCACMALADPLDDTCSETRCKRLKSVNFFVLCFFGAEMIVKMLAMGVIGKRSYLSEGWNRLDFLIVSAGIFDELSSLDGAYLVTIRLVRVLRPLRAINRVPSIRILVTLLLEALPLLGNVFALAFLVLFIFGIVGVQLWQGVLRNRCFLNSTLLNNATFTDPSTAGCYYRPSIHEPDFLCSLPSDSGIQRCSDMPKLQSKCWQSSHVSTGNYCHSEAYHFSNSTFNNSYFQCSQDGPNPFYTTVSFDNIGLAWVAIFQIITLEGWTEIMYLIQEAHHYWNWIYFVILILIGPFFLVNLCLVVLAMQFQETKTRELQLLEEDRLKKLEAQKVFTQTKWGKVMNLMKTNISESLQKRSDQHVHHHHHIHHHYYHEHHVQNPTSPRQDSFVSVATNREGPAKIPTVVLSSENTPTHSPPAFHIQQEPNDSIISLELTSNCKISQNFLSPIMPYSGRISPTWSIGSTSLDRFSFSQDAASSASASATVSVNVTANQIHHALVQPTNTQNIARTKVIASASANASIIAEQATKPTQDCTLQREESLKKTDTTAQKLNVVNSFKNKPSSSHNTLKTLDVSTLNTDVSSLPIENRGGQKTAEIYRQKTFSEATDAEGNVISNATLQRRDTQRSLDDRFGSMFDIQRFGQYYVSQERTSLEKSREICSRLANSASFMNFIMVVILINTITMATEHYRQPESLNEFLEISNLLFISIFTLELIIKIFGDGIRAYASQWFNIFDGFIVVISIIEVIVLGSGGLSVLRSIRLLRIFRLIRPIRHQLIVMVHTMASVMTFTALLFLFMFTFAVLGMNLFGGKIRLLSSDCNVDNVRSNFDTFLSAMITIFQILTLEDWNVVMQNAMRSTSHWAAIYFITLTTIGYYVLFNLLVAILVEGFTNPVLLDPNELEDEQPVQDIEQKEPVKTNLTTGTDWLSLIKGAKRQSSIPQSSPSSKKDDDDFENLADLETDASQPYTKNTTKTLQTPSSYCGSAMRGVIGKPYQLANVFGKSDNSHYLNRHSRKPARISMDKENNLPKNKVMKSIELKPFSLAQKSVSKTDDSSLQGKEPCLDHCLCRNNHGFRGDNRIVCKNVKPKIIITSADEIDVAKVNEETASTTTTTCSNHENTLDINNSKSLFIFSKSNKFRQSMIKISTSKWFDNVILFLILVSCVFMVLDLSRSETAEQTDLLYSASFVFTILFTIEVVIKVIAQGLVIGKNTYLRLGWNVLDFIIVIVSWLHVITSSFNSTSPGILGSVKVLRALRTLRPLRMIRRAPGLKLVVEALLHSLKPIGNTVLIAGIFFVVFGILGVQLFKGAFYHCDDDSNVTTKQECLKRNLGKWVNRPYNFDDLAQAFVTMFVLATRDGWVTIMHYGVDTVGVDKQPKLNNNQWKLLYFVSFLMVVGFLVLNMIVGIVVNNYQLCQEKQEKSERKMKISHSESTTVIEDKTQHDPLRGLCPSSFRGRCFRLCHNKYWDLAIAFVICVNVILMSLEHYQMSKNYKLFLDVNNYICTGIFIIEAFIKLTAYGYRSYFKDRWNILDFMVVVFSVAGIIMDLIHNAVKLSVKPTVVRALRILRIIRVLKLFKVAKGVRSLLDTIMKSLPQVANLGILLFLLFFIYSSLGIQLFGAIECSQQYSCHGLDERHANFHNFQTAMLTLFRVATGDNWNTIFMDTLRFDCDSSAMCKKNCCFSKYVAPLYFTTFVLATHFVLLNVLVAVLMKDLKASRKKLAADLSRETLDKRVLKLTMSATKFVKQKAFSRRSKNPDDPGEGQIELKNMQHNLAPD